MDYLKKLLFMPLCKKEEIQKFLDQHVDKDRKCVHCGYLLGRNTVSLIEQMFNAEQSVDRDKSQCKACKSRYYIVDWEKEKMQEDAEEDTYLKEKVSAFFHETSIHGVKAVAHSQNKIRRFFYTIMVFIFTFLLGRSLIMLTIDYYSYPYIKQYTAMVKDSMGFPGITICNLNEVQTNNITLSSILRDGILSSNFSHPVFSIEAETIYSYLFYTSFEKFACVFDIEYSCDNSWTYTYMLINMYPYNCIAFNVSEPLESNMTGSDNGLILTLSFNQLSDWHTSGVRIFLHNPLRDADEHDSSFHAGPGLTTFAVIQPESINLLGYPYHPKEEDCLQSKETFNVYSQVNCKLECRSKYIASVCGCLYPFTKGNIRKCTYRDVFTCGKRASGEFKQNKSILKNCNCFPSCTYMKYVTRTSTAYYKQSRIRPTDFEIRMYYESFVLKEVSEVPKYQSDAILGQFGGQMGLFLGASLITISEVVELIITFIINKSWKLLRSVYKLR